MLPWNLFKNQVEMSDNLIKVLKNKPLGLFVR